MVDEGNSSKSVFAYILFAVLGDICSIAPASLFVKGKRSEANPEMEMLVEKSLVIADEVHI